MNCGDDSLSINKSLLTGDLVCENLELGEISRENVPSVNFPLSIATESMP